MAFITNNILSEGSISGTTFFSGSTNLSNIFTTSFDISNSKISGGTFNSNSRILILTNNTGGTVTVTGITDTFQTGGTFNPNTRILTLTNNTGGTFTVTGITDTFQTGGTFNANSRILTLTNNTGGTFTVTGITDTFQTGGTLSNGIATFTNNTGGTFTVTGFTDTFTTGFTYISSANTLTINRNQGQPALSVLVNTMSGLTINGGFTANTLNSGAMVLGYRDVGANYTATTSDYTINCSASSITIKIPTPIMINNKTSVFNIKNSNTTGNITVSGLTSQTFDGDISLTIRKQNSVMIQGNLSGNYIII